MTSGADEQGDTVDHQAARELIVSTLESSGLDVDEVGDDRWMTMLAGQWKRTIPLLLDLDERHLHVTSLLAGVPDEGHAEVYALLLHRNEKPAPVHFALDDEGDIVLVGHVPLTALSERVLDEVLGAVLTISDETFNQVLRAGFASYIAAEQDWRAKNDMPANPVSTEG